jgi:DivIVA domain-containing protein
LLTPEEIQSREFLVSLRGYDRDEVHAFLSRVAEQLAQTEAKSNQLQQRIDRLKQQQPSVAAAEPAPSAASPEPSAMFAEIGKETQRILEAAQEAGQQIQRKARQEADRDLQSARGQAAKLIAEGERRREHIERIVSELEQARAAMSVQLRGVGRTIEQTLRELSVDSDGAGSSTMREAMGSAAAEDSAAVTQAADAATDARSAPPKTAPSRPDKAEPATAAQETAPEPAAEAEPAEDTSAAAAPASEAATESETPAAPAPPAEADNAPQEVPAEPVVGPDEGTAEEPAAPAPAATPETTTAAVAPGGGDGTAVADTAGDAATEPAMPPAAEAGEEEQADPQGLRAAALSPLHPKLVRKVKRELQEIQNIALDKLRRAKGQGEVDDFLPSERDTSGIGEGSAELLEQAWRAGVQSAGVLADAELATPEEPPPLADDFLADAAQRVRSGLSATLRMGLSADEGQQALSDRIGAVFSEFKGAQSEELAATHLIRAYEHGLLGAWANGGVAARVWVMGREPRCPEAKCRTNEGSGAVAVGDSFPSGHDVPPIHVGCTCTTIPAES